MKTNNDATRLLNGKKHAKFFSECFDFSLVTVFDPMNVDKCERQVERDANHVIDSAPSHQSLLKAAEKDLRACGLLDFAHVLSELSKSPVALAKKVRHFIDVEVDKPPPKKIESEDALRLVFSASLSVEAYRVIILINLSLLQESVEFWHIPTTIILK